ncbi:MAG TPA: hypothetical protein VN578_22285 [Candidatus Binatia bacterium]|jgi:hypothetical protein|nr:hypothetical protein [Candidatus Binatia bacterium]
MKLFRFVLIMAIFSWLGGGCNPKQSPDFAFIDRYLETWDRFAQGANELMPRLRKDGPEFQRHLADALSKNDSRAPSRVVFFGVVQVGGFIPIDSPVGQAFQARFGSAVPVFTDEKDGAKSFFAGDLYFWWEKHNSEYDTFPLYEDWRQRPFAKNVAIKMYESAAKNSK